MRKTYKDVYVHNDEVIHGFFEGYRFLSNFHLCDIFHDGLLYPSTENAYQAAKFTDLNFRRQFTTITAREAKILGRDTDLTDEEVARWDVCRLETMIEITQLKYANKNCRSMLMDTGFRYLEETNYWKDHYWGVCDGRGLNMLGKVIMDIRLYWMSAFDIDPTLRHVKTTDKSSNDVFNI